MMHDYHYLAVKDKLHRPLSFLMKQRLLSNASSFFQNEQKWVTNEKLNHLQWKNSIPFLLVYFLIKSSIVLFLNSMLNSLPIL